MDKYKKFIADHLPRPWEKKFLRVEIKTLHPLPRSLASRENQDLRPYPNKMDILVEGFERALAEGKVGDWVTKNLGKLKLSPQKF